MDSQASQPQGHTGHTGQVARLVRAGVCIVMGLLLSVSVFSGAGLATSLVYAATNITVNTTADELNNDGDCSLREAVVAANTDTATDICPAGGGLDTLVVPPGTYTLTRAGAGEDNAATGDLDIRSAVVISGFGAANTVIDGNAQDRVLHVLGAAAVNLQGISLLNGRPPAGTNGGGLYVSAGSSVTLIESTVRDNVAAGPGLNWGGGIFIAGNGQLTLGNSSVIDNNVQSVSGSGYTAFGGGIHNGGSLTVYNSLVSGNTLTTTAQGDGAGISNGGTLSLHDSLLIYNVAGPGGNGGGLANYGTAVIIGSDVLSNTGPVYGAGILSRSSLTVIDSWIAHNVGQFGILITGSNARLTNTRLETNSGSGLTLVNGQVTVAQSIIEGNASGLGNFDGFLSILDSSVIANGSGIGTAYGETNITRSTIAENISYGVDNGAGTVRIVNSTISGNGYVGVANSNTGTTTLTNTSVMSNEVGGLANGSGTLNLANSLIGGSTEAGTPTADCVGTITSAVHNLIQALGDCLIIGDSTGNVFEVSPNVSPLQDNGGWTHTHALLPGSRAIDAGQMASCNSRDQRGLFRPADGDGVSGSACDVGAYELNGLVPLNVFFPIVRR